MLISTTITAWQGLGKDTRVSGTSTAYLLNGNRIQGLEIRASTKSKFLYLDNPNDFREKPSYVEADEAVTTITTDADKTFQSTFMILSFYTDNDATQATFLRRIQATDIVYVRKSATSPATKSWVRYLEGSKVRELLCAYSIMQVRELGDTGDLTTP